LFCPGNGPSAPPPLVSGYDGAQFLNLRADLARQPVPELAKPAPPALVIRPECDVMTWAAARDYRDRFGGTLVMVPGMGHVPDATNLPLLVKLWTAFLEGAELPLPAWTGDDDPASPRAR
jgi:hypothetical protein